MNITRKSRVAMGAVIAALLGASLLRVALAHDEEMVSPSEVRRVALEAGLDSLRNVKAPEPDNLDEFLKSGRKARLYAIMLGKALFWDMQVGSDGQACASCHFYAGADNRTKNQLSPGLKNEDPNLRSTFDPTASGEGGPNYELTPADFPFRRLEDPQDRTSFVLHDSDDVCSSQGVFSADFLEVVRGESADRGIPSADAVFNVGGLNVRRVEPRNTPSVINAVYNFANFWDGSAHNVFNGVSPGGPLDGDATVLVREDGKLVPTAIRINNASLASQAMAPPQSDLEMAFFDRPFRDLARKLLSLTPLGGQLVHPKDSVLGKYSKAKLDDGRVSGKTGLSISYADLIKRSFEKRFWNSDEKIDGYSQMESNFSLFFGIAIQMYESTLVSDLTPFDQFMEGADDALTHEQQEGLLVFINRGPGLSDDPVFLEFAQGNCVSCHRGAEFTAATYSSVGGAGGATPALIETQKTTELTVDLVVGDQTAYFDVGFSNIGVRPTAEDLGRGGTAFGLPLSFARQGLLGLPFAPGLPACGGVGEPACPEGNRVAVDGAFKVPGLRNVELTGPYFHNGGQGTLGQVIAFYERLGDFSNENLPNIDPNLARIFFTEPEEELLVDFMLGLTDDRVRDEREPFDHPQLLVPNGHPGIHSALDCIDAFSALQACDDLLEIPPVGAKGRSGEGLRPLGAFLNLVPSSTLPRVAPTSVDVRVGASADDAEEDASQRVDPTSSDLELIQEATPQTVGIRFAGVDVPPRARIVRAHVQFAADETQGEPTSLVIQGEAADDAPGFTAAGGSISSRTRTKAAVPWSAVPEWATRKEAGPGQRTPDLSAVVQEIVDRGGWARGNALVVILTGTGHRTAESFDGDSARAPLLHVEYEASTPTPP